MCTLKKLFMGLITATAKNVKSVGLVKPFMLQS